MTCSVIDKTSPSPSGTATAPAISPAPPLRLLYRSSFVACRIPSLRRCHNLPLPRVASWTLTPACPPSRPAAGCDGRRRLADQVRGPRNAQQPGSTGGAETQAEMRGASIRSGAGLRGQEADRARGVWVGGSRDARREAGGDQKGSPPPVPPSPRNTPTPHPPQCLRTNASFQRGCHARVAPRHSRSPTSVRTPRRCAMRGATRRRRSGSCARSGSCDTCGGTPT